MYGRFVRRIGEFILTVFVAASAVFFLSRMAPSDPVEVLLGENATEADRTALRKELGLDRPLAEQYFSFLASLASFDPGMSLSSRRPVAEEISECIPATARLAFLALILSVAMGGAAGLLSAMHEKGPMDAAFGLSTSLMIVAPSFVSGPLLLLVFAVKYPVLPVSGDGGALSYLLPAITLAIPFSAYSARVLRTSLAEERRKPYFLAALQKGRGVTSGFFRHLLPNAAAPFVQVSGLQLGGLLTGTIIAEKVFRIQGIGSLLARSVFSRDYPLLTALIVFFSVVYLSANLLSDLVSSYFDPRLRNEAA